MRIIVSKNTDGNLLFCIAITILQPDKMVDSFILGTGAIGLRYSRAFGIFGDKNIPLATDETVQPTTLGILHMINIQNKTFLPLVLL